QAQDREQERGRLHGRLLHAPRAGDERPGRRGIREVLHRPAQPVGRGDETLVAFGASGDRPEAEGRAAVRRAQGSRGTHGGGEAGPPRFPQVAHPQGTIGLNTQSMPGLRVLVGTRKGLFVLKSDRRRRAWSMEGPHFLGQIVNHALLDPRDGRTMLAAVRAGHLGPTVFRSGDQGRTWKESARPPAFEKAREGEKGESVSHVFWLTPGAASTAQRWYAGTSPQ